MLTIVCRILAMCVSSDGKFSALWFELATDDVASERLLKTLDRTCGDGGPCMPMTCKVAQL